MRADGRVAGPGVNVAGAVNGTAAAAQHECPERGAQEPEEPATDRENAAGDFGQGLVNRII